MRMRSLAFSFALLFSGFVPSAALAQRPAAVDASEPAAPTPLPTGRIQGAVTRPKDGVQHPDLDAAWIEYDEQIETAAKAIEQAIEKGLNAAAASGDLDAALKWKTAGEQFQKDGQIPEVLDSQRPQGRPKPKPTKPEPSPQSLVAEARARLAKAYESAEQQLTKQHDFEKAKQVRSERESLTPAGDNSKTCYKKTIITPSGERQATNEVFELVDHGKILIDGKPSALKWSRNGNRVRIDIGGQHGFVELTIGADSCLRGENRGRADGAVWGWELLPSPLDQSRVAVAGVVYLSDVRPIDLRVPNDGKPFQQGTMTVGGVDNEHGLFLHPPTNGSSAATFKVPGGYRTFLGSVAMHDTATRQKTALVFKVFDDRNKLLWKSKPVASRGVVEDFAVSIEKTSSVTLVVECPGDYAFAHAVWVEPRFTP
jgi:hypothetical protein